MKHLIVLFFTLLSCGALWAQSKMEINLADWKGKIENVPFTISEVVNNEKLPNDLGLVPIKKKKVKRAIFASDSELMIEKFVDKNFLQQEGFDIRMEINSIQIKMEKVGQKSKADFFYSCKFYRGSSTKSLYTFIAKNPIKVKKKQQTAITFYVGRAIQTSILNFKKAYANHPEWSVINKSTPDISVTAKTYHNQFLPSGDTIALDGLYQLQVSDFAGSVQEEEKDDAYSFLMLSYSLDAVDDDNRVAIKIYPKAFFLRSKSWIRTSEDSNPIAYQQLLFDLATHHGNLLHQALSNYEYTAGFYRAEANKIYNDLSANYFDKLDQLQAETRYGTLPGKVKEWREKINNYLKK